MKKNNVILEGITYDSDSDSFNIDFKHDNKTDLVALTYASKMVVKKSTLYKIIIYYAYNLNVKHIDKEIRDKLTNLFKYQQGITPDQFDLLLNKAAIKFNNIIPISNYDIIIAPSSKSNLLKQLLSKIKAKSANTLLADNVLVKNAIDNIKVDIPKYISTAKDDKDKQKRIKQLNAFFKSSTKSGEFKIKEVLPQFRKFFSNFLIFKSDTDRQIYNAIANGNILLVDDIKTSGETLKEMLRNINTYLPKSVTIFIFFRNETRGK